LAGGYSRLRCSSAAGRSRPKSAVSPMFPENYQVNRADIRPFFRLSSSGKKLTDETRARVGFSRELLKERAEPSKPKWRSKR
jgi:hypothetical protein